MNINKSQKFELDIKKNKKKNNCTDNKKINKNIVFLPTFVGNSQFIISTHLVRVF
jgi:hypothetical protein